jgi:ABC-type uncharacterized transport system substrate-binding protein
MNTKTDLEGGPQKARDAFEAYEEFQPDGVIAADDNAQAMFVVPYLKEKVETPVMFCGVNAEPDQYGYPASNVSGILERLNIEPSIVFAQQLVPSIKTVSFIEKKGPSAQAVLQQVEHEAENYPAEFVAFNMPETLNEALSMTAELREQSDLLFLSGLQGLPNEGGTPVAEKEAIALITETFGKPTIAATIPRVKAGALCAVLAGGAEQGTTAAKMLLQAMQGTPVEQIPITKNQYGRRVLNVQAMKELGIEPQHRFLVGVELVKTER